MERLLSMPDDTKEIQPAEKLSFLRYFAKFLLVKRSTPVFPSFNGARDYLYIVSPLFLLFFFLSFSPFSFCPSPFSSHFFIGTPCSLYESVSRARISRQSRFLTGAPGERSTLSGQQKSSVNILQKMSPVFREFKGTMIKERKRRKDVSRKIRETVQVLQRAFCNFNSHIALHEALSLFIPKDTFCNTLSASLPTYFEHPFYPHLISYSIEKNSFADQIIHLLFNPRLYLLSNVVQTKISKHRAPSRLFEFSDPVRTKHK